MLAAAAPTTDRSMNPGRTPYGTKPGDIAQPKCNHALRTPGWAIPSCIKFALTRTAPLPKHHVGGRRADHGPKHEPGQNPIRYETRRYSTTKMQSRSPHTRMGDPFLHQICLDEDGPVTEASCWRPPRRPRTEA